MFAQDFINSCKKNIQVEDICYCIQFLDLLKQHLMQPVSSKMYYQQKYVLTHKCGHLQHKFEDTYHLSISVTSDATEKTVTSICLTVEKHYYTCWVFAGNPTDWSGRL